METVASGVERAREPHQRKGMDARDALRELVRGRLEAVGPTTATEVARSRASRSATWTSRSAPLRARRIRAGGRFTPGGRELEWCERRCWPASHRYTLDRCARRSSRSPLRTSCGSCCWWQRAAPDARAEGRKDSRRDGAADAVEAPAGAWKRRAFRPGWANTTLVARRPVVFRGRSPGAVCRRRRPRNGHRGPIRTTRLPCSAGKRGCGGGPSRCRPIRRSSRSSIRTRAAFDALENEGVVLRRLVKPRGTVTNPRWRRDWAKLVAWGIVNATARRLRAMLVRPIGAATRRVGGEGQVAAFGGETEGRWSRGAAPGGGHRCRKRASLRRWPWQLLRRMGGVPSGCGERRR